MLPLFEMLTKAQNGNAVAEMARRFGLSQKQVEDAMAALMPAFSTGLKRNTADPMGLAGLMQTLGSAQHATYFDDMRKAFSPQGMQEGTSVLDYLFGSPEVSRAVAEHASQTTGIAQDTLKQMLPPIAATLMGGLQKQATGRLDGSSEDNPVVRMMRLLTRQQAEWAEELGIREKAPAPPENPYAKAMEQMFGMAGGTGAADGGPAAQSPFSLMGMGEDNPFGRAFRDMLEGGFGQVHQPGAAPPEEELEPEPEPSTQDEPTGVAADGYPDIFGDMFETGRRTQEDYLRSMEAIFDQYSKGTQRR